MSELENIELDAAKVEVDDGEEVSVSFMVLVSTDFFITIEFSLYRIHIDVRLLGHLDRK